MKVLIGYECSGIVRRAFRERGVEAWSCDVLPAMDRSQHHIQDDIWNVVDRDWDFGIFHPSCQLLTTSGAWAFKDPDHDRYPGTGYHQRVQPGTLTGAARREARAAALDDFKRLLDLPYPKAIENPAASFVNKAIRPPDQIIQPYDFGDDASKATGLWLDRLPPLVPDPAKRVPGRLVTRPDGRVVERWGNQTDSGQNRLTPSEGRWLARSITYPRIATAMAEQWAVRKNHFSTRNM